MTTDAIAVKAQKHFEFTHTDWHIMAAGLVELSYALDSEANLLDGLKELAQKTGKLDEWQKHYDEHQQRVDDYTATAERFLLIDEALHDGSRVMVIAVSRDTIAIKVPTEDAPEAEYAENAPNADYADGNEHTQEH